MRESARIVARFCVPPLGAFVVSNIIYWFAARASGVSYAAPGTRIRWDSFNYLSIARDGYTIIPCQDNPDAICEGTASWFPLFPLLLRPLAFLGIPYEWAGVLVAEGVLLAVLGAVWLLLDAQLRIASLLCLAIAAVSSGIYFHAVFPMGLCALGMLLILIGVKRQQWWIAALGGLIAVMSHSVGLVVIPVLAVSGFFAWRRKSQPQLNGFTDNASRRLVRFLTTRQVLPGIGVFLAALIGLFLVALVFKIDTGYWDAYIRSQEGKFGYGEVRNPWSNLIQFFQETPMFPVSLTPVTSLVYKAVYENYAVQSQWIFFTGFLALAMGFALTRVLKQKRADLVDVTAILLGLGLFALPLLTGAMLSWYRVWALIAVVCVVLLRDAPRWLLAGVFVGGIGVSMVASAAFYSNALV